VLLPNQLIHRKLSQDTPLHERLWVTPMLDPDLQIGPASVDVRLGTSFAVFRRIHSGIVDPASRVPPRHERFDCAVGDSFLIHPHQFVLATTLEFVRLPNDLAAYLTVRSSWSRFGLVVGTSMMLQPGFAGCIALEVSNEGAPPLRLYPGARIAQLAFEQLAEPTMRPHENRYVGAIGPELSKVAIRPEEMQQLERVKNWLDRIND